MSEIAYDVESVHGCMKVSAVKFRNVLFDVFVCEQLFVKHRLSHIVCGQCVGEYRLDCLREAA